MQQNELTRFIDISLELDMPLMLWGDSTGSNSEFVRRVVEGRGYVCHVIRIDGYQPTDVDLVGVPYIDQNNRTRRARPPIWPDENSDQLHLIILEELAEANLDMQVGTRGLLDNHKYGQHVLTSETRIIAINHRRRGEATGPMDPGLLSRFLHYDLQRLIDNADELE